MIFDHIKRIYPETLIREFTSYEIEGIQKLVDEKYESWEWNYGYSPRYCYQGQVTTATLNLSFEIVVKNGLIESLIPNAESQIFNELIQKSIVGKNHNPPTIESLYQSNKAFFLKYGVDKSALLTAFFG